MDSMRELACAVALGDVAKARECLAVVERDYKHLGFADEIELGRADAIHIARRQTAKPARLKKAA